MEGKFDYIIVGGGSAGCVLANRLSAQPGTKVLLLEAGPRDWHPLIHIPVGYAHNMKRSTINWMYETEPEAGAGGRRFQWPRGKVLGGSSAINGMINVRGQSQDYDHWRQLGNEGWSWDDVVPYFRRLENFEAGTGETRGRGGPLHISIEEPSGSLGNVFAEALKGMGLEDLDTNSGEQEGFGFVQSTTKNGRRQSTAVAYLNPARGRPNLTIVTNAFTQKILFEGRRAIGVQYERHGRQQTARCAREVILSAGAINSPQLLELSGIGKAEILNGLGIEILQDSPNVGENLQDHFAVYASRRVVNAKTINELSRGLPLIREVLKYIVSRKGLLTVTPCQIVAYMRTRQELSAPDIQVGILPATMDPETNALEKEPGMTCVVVPARPESRGSIHVTSQNPRVYPRIHANYLSAEADQRTTVAALRLARQFFDQPAFAPYRGEELSPGASCQSDEELLAFARETGSTVFHPTSTCRMGSDPGAVVDSRLRVNGVAGLRVVDASVMPTLISGNTNTPTIMIAEKAADMILADAAQ